MRKTFLFILALCATMMAWGADNVRTEKFSKVENFTMVSDRTFLEGDLVEWAIRYGRRNGDKVGDLDVEGTWLQGQSKYGYLEMNAALEGGIKTLDFDWGHNGGENGYTVKLRVFKRGTSGWEANPVKVCEHKSTSATAWHEHVTLDINMPTNARIKFDNLSVKTSDGKQPTDSKGRPVIGEITVTPYLFYTEKNREEFLSAGTFDCSLQIDNTDGEGTITYSSSNTDVVSFANSANPEATLVGDGEATITATWSEASTSFKLKVNVLPVPTVTFPGITDGKKSVALNVESFTEAATVDMTVPVVYSSSKTNVATVDNNGKVTVLTTGTTEITAKVEAKEGEYKEASATYTLTVTASEASEVSFVEKYGETGTWENYTDGNKITGTDNIFYWVANNTRRQSGDKIGSDVGLRFRHTLTEGYHLLPDPEHNEGIMEGGIKRIAFKYKEAKDGSGVNLKIYAGTEERILKTDPNPGVDLPFAANFFVKENTSLKMYNTKDASVVTIGPISIVPYVLYTEKAQNANAADGTYDATTGLINNAPAGEVTYSIVTKGVQSTIDAAKGEVDMSNVTTSEDIVIKASYGDAYTTMNLHVNALPIPVVTFPNLTDNKKTVDMNQAPFTESISVKVDDEEVSEPTITYESSDEAVAKVDEDGEVTVIGAGTAMITATIDQTTTYKGTAASYELTITDPEDDAITETFERNAGGASDADRVGAYYTWTITTGARTKATDILFNKTPSIWLSGNGGASMETTIEGGVKRVSFLWNKFSKDPASVTIDVTAGDITRSITKAVTSGENQNNPDLVFNSNFGIKSNTNLKIANPQSTTALQIGPIAITPYLLYTTKYDEVKRSKGSYVNTDIINNTNGGTITFSAEPAELVEFQQNPTYPGTVNLKGAGEVTITATWIPSDAADDEVVTTSYVLKINDKEYMDAHFETEGKLEKVLGNTFTNAVTYTKGEGTATYSSDDTNVAEVDADGKVTIKGIGTTTIKAHLDATENYFAWDGSYILVVRTGVAADNKLVEHFTQMPKGLISIAGGEEVEGDIDVTWLAYSARRGANDTIGGVGIQGNNIFTKGYIKSQTAVEGGIKYFSLNWKQWATENNCTLKLHVKLGNSDYSMEKAGTELATYEHYFFAINAGIKSNVGIALYNESYNEDGPLASNGRITFDAFEIVPYLFYTDKEKSFDIADGEIPATYTHPIINNIDAGSVTYAITGDNLGSFSTTTGEITFDEDKQGTATITASWEGVTTSYTLTVTRKQDVTVSFANPTEKAIVGKDYTLQAMTVSPESTGDQSYESSDNTVAEVVEGALQIKKAGVVTITGTVAETETHNSASASYQLVIYPAETTPKIIQETYSQIPNAGVKHTREKYYGDYNLLWYYRNGRSKSTDKMVSGDKAFWFCHVVTEDNQTYNSSYIETTFTGGIKAVYFDWKSAGTGNNGNLIKIQIKADGTPVDEITVIGTQDHIDNDQPYALSMEQKKSVKLTIANLCCNADETKDIEGKLAIGPITIVPYLFFRDTLVSVKMSEGTTYTNGSLINNTDGGTIEYSLENNDGEALIDPETGEVTLLKGGEVIVKATWQENNTVTTSYKLKIQGHVTIKEGEDNTEILEANAGQTVDVTIERSPLVSGVWNSLCLPFAIDKAEVLGDATVAQIGKIELVGDVLNIWISKVTGATLEAGMPYLVLPTEQVVLSGDYENKQLALMAGAQVMGVVTLHGIFSPFEMTANDETKLFLGQPNAEGHNLFYASEDGYLKGMRAYFSINTPSGAPVRVGRIGIQQTPTELGGEADRLNGRQAMKVLRDGQFYIIRETKTYNAQGVEVQ